MTKPVRHLMPVVIAVVIGPLIAVIPLWAYILLGDLLSNSMSPIGEELGLLYLYLIFAYILGAPIALLAGILASILMIWREPSLFVAIAATVIAVCGFMAVAATGLLGAVEWTNGRNNLLFTLVLAVIAAAGCWLFARFLAQRFAKDTAAESKPRSGM